MDRSWLVGGRSSADQHSILFLPTVRCSVHRHCKALGEYRTCFSREGDVSLKEQGADNPVERLDNCNEGRYIKKMGTMRRYTATPGPNVRNYTLWMSWCSDGVLHSYRCCHAFTFGVLFSPSCILFSAWYICYLFPFTRFYFLYSKCHISFTQYEISRLNLILVSLKTPKTITVAVLLGFFLF